MRQPEEILKDLAELAKDVQSPDVVWPYEWAYYAHTMAELERELNSFVQLCINRDVDKEPHKP